MALNGIDIASYQQGIDLGKVPCDFVIIKATQGTGYVNPAFQAQYTSAKSNGKRLGIYHYASGHDAIAEVKHFLQTIGTRYKEAVLCLDWEKDDNRFFGTGSQNAWVDEWMNYVEVQTGRKPLLYIQQSAMGAFTKKYGDRLWIAQYASMDSTSYQAKPWREGSYTCMIRQYSSSGKLNGWNGRLDLDKFYGSKSDWDKLVGGSSAKATKPQETASAKPQKGSGITVDGSWGKATTKAAQKFFGTTVDGIVSNQCAWNKKYLPGCSKTSWQFLASGYQPGSNLVKAIQRWCGASADGQFGHATAVYFQKKLGVSADGSIGPQTVRAWQKFLNSH